MHFFMMPGCAGFFKLPEKCMSAIFNRLRRKKCFGNLRPNDLYNRTLLKFVFESIQRSADCVESQIERLRKRKTE